MSDVRIFSPARNVMQSAPFAEGRWIVQYLKVVKRSVDPIMGWTSSNEVPSNTQFIFETKEEAIEYCKRKNLSYEISEPKKRKVHIKPYAQILMQDPSL